MRRRNGDPAGRRPPGASRTDRTDRDTYRHGDLHRALLTAGIDLARSGGPSAVVLRETTRRAGVTPNAAYRHFADQRALLQAVCAAALAELAVSIEDELATMSSRRDPAEAARAHLRAVGTAYLRFARDEPGLFQTAFSVPDDLAAATDTAKGGNSGLTPYQLLGAALDDMVTAGVLPLERRPGAELLAWSAVHGLAVLLVSGPLRSLDETQLARTADQLLDMVLHGI